MASIRAWQWSPASDYISCPRQPWHIDVVVRARLGISRHQLREVFGVGSNAELFWRLLGWEGDPSW